MIPIEFRGSRENLALHRGSNRATNHETGRVPSTEREQGREIEATNKQNEPAHRMNGRPSLLAFRSLESGDSISRRISKSASKKPSAKTKKTQMTALQKHHLISWAIGTGSFLMPFVLGLLNHIRRGGKSVEDDAED